jgi:MinD superfamily P-loop ATPase
MKIAIASGKGGTGKTTLSTNLVLALSGAHDTVAYLDCDVEEPNGHIFLPMTVESTRPVTVPVPDVDPDRCTQCGACGEACRYSAILALPSGVITFPELCHGCGGCIEVCEEHAIREVPRTVGTVKVGRTAEGIRHVSGLLDVGQVLSPPVVRGVLDSAPAADFTVIDAPPGTTCPVIEAVRDADVVLLVTEPTPFGLCDLKLAIEMVRSLGIPFAVAINRAGIGDRKVHEYCADEGIDIVLEIADDRRIAEAYSRGEPAIRVIPDLSDRLLGLTSRLAKLASGPRPEPTIVEWEYVEPRTLAPTPTESASGDLREQIPELVVISGKGGTGKTSVAAALFALAGNAAAADCDVDAADLHLVLDPTVKKRWPFSGGFRARIDPEFCIGCGLCQAKCRFDAVHEVMRPGLPTYEIEALACEGCGVCALVCPSEAVTLLPALSGEWYVSDTRHGPMVHARLSPAGENSGKLVSLVKREANALAVAERRQLVIVDGSPGIGCPVIASVTGARLALIVAEPTLSGLHDMTRVAELTRHFGIETALCINKADINPEIADRLEREGRRLGLRMMGRIRYDPAVTDAMVRSTTVVEIEPGPAARDIEALWTRLSDALGVAMKKEKVKR